MLPLHMLYGGAVLCPCSATLFEAVTMMPKPTYLPELGCPPVRDAPQAAPPAAGLEGALPALIVFQCM